MVTSSPGRQLGTMAHVASGAMRVWVVPAFPPLAILSAETDANTSIRTSHKKIDTRIDAESRSARILPHCAGCASTSLIAPCRSSGRGVVFRAVSVSLHRRSGRFSWLIDVTYYTASCIRRDSIVVPRNCRRSYCHRPLPFVCVSLRGGLYSGVDRLRESGCRLCRRRFKDADCRGVRHSAEVFIAPPAGKYLGCIANRSARVVAMELAFWARYGSHRLSNIGGRTPSMESVARYLVATNPS
jgi:hypothetical protein